MLDIEPSNLLVVIFLVLCIKQLINAIGKSKLENIGWTIYCKVLPNVGNSKFRLLAAKQEELNKVAKERKSISAQDQYAKWTKLNRQFDKLNAELSELKQETTASKGQISKYIGYGIMCLTSLPIWFFRVWFRKAVLFYFPVGVLPHSFEWFLALPFITTGGVGLSVWMFASNKVISSLLFLVMFPFEKEIPAPVPQEADTKEPKKMAT